MLIDFVALRRIHSVDDMRISCFLSFFSALTTVVYFIFISVCCITLLSFS